jgi:hypothetical protein
MADNFTTDPANLTATDLPILSADNIANISATGFFCVFLCCFGYFMYWLQDRQERNARVRMALARNNDIDKRERQQTVKSHGESSEPVRETLTEVAESETLQQVNVTNPPTIPLGINYNDQISVTLASPKYVPIEEYNETPNESFPVNPVPHSPISQVNAQNVEFRSGSSIQESSPESSKPRPLAAS